MGGKSKDGIAWIGGSSMGMCSSVLMKQIISQWAKHLEMSAIVSLIDTLRQQMNLECDIRAVRDYVQARHSSMAVTDFWSFDGTR